MYILGYSSALLNGCCASIYIYIYIDVCMYVCLDVWSSTASPGWHLDNSSTSLKLMINPTPQIHFILEPSLKASKLPIPIPPVFTFKLFLPSNSQHKFTALHLIHTFILFFLFGARYYCYEFKFHLLLRYIYIHTTTRSLK